MRRFLLFSWTIVLASAMAMAAQNAPTPSEPLKLSARSRAAVDHE